jgi:23S rRNA pseudouridine1911/1915/1917 synthase
MFQWTVSSPQRLDAFLADQHVEISRSRIQKAISRGSVEVNGEVVLKPAYKLQKGDQVLVQELDEQRDQSIVSEDLHIDVLYEDDDCMVIQKPSGFAVHPAAGMPPEEQTILHGVAFLFAERAIPFFAEAVLVHRLDKETTGCLLIAKSASAHVQLQKQFEDRIVQKKYLAIVYGVPEAPIAVIDAPIGRNLTDRTKMSILRTRKSREAKTTYTVLDSTHESSLLECALHTGRTHQVRVHLRSIGHPILGDFAYASSASQKFSTDHHISHLCLHAWRLSFLSPSLLKEIAVEAPIPTSFSDAINVLTLQSLSSNPSFPTMV